MVDRLSVFGLGKAGLPLALTLAEAGFEVYGVDKNPNVVESLLKGISPFEGEPGLEPLLKKLVQKNFFPTIDGIDAVKKCAVHIIIVPVFLSEPSHDADFTYLEDVCKTIGKGLKKGDLVILETTVPVGTTENKVAPWLAKFSGLKNTDFLVAFSPERIMTGFALSRYKNFPKVVGGATSEATERAYQIYSKFCTDVHKVSNARTAELIKISEGVYRNINIAIANELYKVAQESNIDFWEVRQFARHEYCNIMEPGAVGGHCTPVYPWFLIKSFDVPLVKSAVEVNEGMVDFLVGEVKRRNVRKVGVVGMSWREGVNELKFSRAVVLIERLVKEKFDVYVFDKKFSSDEIKQLGAKPLSNFKEMDVVITMNKTPEVSGELCEISSKVIDLKNVLKRFD